MMNDISLIGPGGQKLGVVQEVSFTQTRELQKLVMPSEDGYIEPELVFMPGKTTITGTAKIVPAPDPEMAYNIVMDLVSEDGSYGRTTLEQCHFFNIISSGYVDFVAESVKVG